MKATAPASAANLGPGFDAIAVALELYVTVEIKESPYFNVHSKNLGSNIEVNSDHIASRVLREIYGHDNFYVEIDSAIPLARGLGSSAALAVAVAGAAGAADPLKVAVTIDGHPENAGASVLGGLVAATMENGKPVAKRIDIDSRNTFLVVVPDFELSTSKARSVLPGKLDLKDVAQNLGSLALMIAGLINQDQFTRAASRDSIHQPFRNLLNPQAEKIIDFILNEGGLGACWSGAGPSILAITDEDNQSLKDKLTRYLAEISYKAEVMSLKPDLGGLQITS